MVSPWCSLNFSPGVENSPSTVESSSKTELVEHRQAFIQELQTSSGLRTTHGAVTYIVAMDYAVHFLVEWLLYN